MLWWVWLAAGLALAILDLLLPGFIFLGFALGAMITGMVLLVPGVTPSLPVLLFGFTIMSLLIWLFLRYTFALPRGQVKLFKHDINDWDRK